MTKDAKKVIADGMAALEFQYGFGEYCGNADGQIVYPYFVGEYIEIESMTESGMQETDFMLTGFSRGSWDDLDDAKEAIERYFGRIDGKRVMTQSGSAIIVLYNNTLIIPQDDAELKSIQINLKIIEWTVN